MKVTPNRTTDELMACTFNQQKKWASLHFKNQIKLPNVSALPDWTDYTKIVNMKFSSLLISFTKIVIM